MNKSLFFLAVIISICSNHLSAQDDLSVQSKLIEDEGKMLYYSEKASWHGTDIFLEKQKNTENIAGYLSYPYLDSIRCIFFSKAPSLQVVFCVTFDKSFDLNKVHISTDTRPFSLDELNLFQIREKAISSIQTDTTFIHYGNTNLNIVPIINGTTKRAYILTGPTINDVVLFGNDYLLNFNDKNEITTIKKLHNNLIPININKEEGKEDIVASMHSHSVSSSQFITPTDICTLMLYQYATGWETHYVISEKYVSIWNCNTNSLNIITREEFEKIKESTTDE